MANSKTIVVGYLYNTNGMAAWNLEVAEALYNSGYNVVLVHSKCISTNPNLPFRTISFDIDRKCDFLSKVLFHLKRFYNKRYSFASILDKYLKSQGIIPDFYLFNQSNLIDAKLKVPQFIKASTYPSTFKNYIHSYYLSADFKNGSFKNLLNHLIEVIGWYFTDWYAYKHSTGVLCHTDILAEELKKSGVNSYFVPPPIHIHHISQILNRKKMVFLTASLQIEDKRKRVKWIIDNFLKSKIEGELHIVGEADDSFIADYASDLNKLKFLGKLSRDEMDAVYQNSDVFLFASTSDTWGYVLTEAMANGLIVIAPDLYPYNYIVGNDDFLFPLHDSQAFRANLKKVSSSPQIATFKKSFHDRAFREFSHEGFVRKIASILV